MLSHFSCVWLFVTLWTIAHQAPLSMDSPGKNTGVGFHALLQGIFPTQGSNLSLLCLLALAGRFFTTSATWGFYGSGSQVVWKLLGIRSKSVSASSKGSSGWVAHPEPIIGGSCVCALSLIHVWLCDPMDYNLPGSSVHEILQARILEWVAIS